MMKRKRKPLPEYYKSWEKLLAWVDEDTRTTAKKIGAHIKAKFENVVAIPRGRYFCFYKGKPSTKSIFAAFLLTKEYLKVRIKTDPRKFKDPKRLVKEKTYRKWFFTKGEEREFIVPKHSEAENYMYAIELIKQSYELAK